MKRKLTAAFILALTMSALCAINVWAENKIESVSIFVNYETWEHGDYYNGDDVTVQVPAGAPYSVEGVSFTNQPDGYWRGGAVPKLKVELEADGNLIFAASAAKEDGIEVSSNNYAEVVSAKRQNLNETLYVYIELEEVAEDDSDWGDTGEYKYNVLSAGAGTTDGAWLKTADGRWWYCNSNRTFTRGTWQKINYKWYYFDENGYMLTGWQWIKRADGHYCCYYLYPFAGPDQGACLLNCKTPDGFMVNGAGEWIMNGVPVVK